MDKKKVRLRWFPTISELNVDGTWKHTGLGIEALVAEKDVEEAKRVFASLSFDRTGSIAQSAAAFTDPTVTPFEGVGILYIDSLLPEDYRRITDGFRDSGWDVDMNDPEILKRLTTKPQ